MRSGKYKKKWRLSSSVHILYIFFSFIWIYPFLWMISSAFKPQGEMLMGGLRLLPKQLTFENFVRAWNVANFDLYFVNTVIVTVSVVLLVLLISSTAGYALGRGNMPGKKVIVAVLVVTMFLPKGATIIPIFTLINSLNLNNTLLGIILAEAGPAHVVAILLFMGYFANIPNELEESAALDGATYITVFRKIMLPLAAPVIATVAIFNFIGAWNSFLIPLTFTLSAPELRTLGVGMYSFFGEYSSDWTALAAGATISIVPIIIVFLFLQKYFIEGLSGAVKG